jgi:hypothetical protein
MGTLHVIGTSLLERFALCELRYGKTCGFMGTALWERCALFELRYGKTCGFMGTALWERCALFELRYLNFVVGTLRVMEQAN